MTYANENGNAKGAAAAAPAAMPDAASLRKTPHNSHGEAPAAATIRARLRGYDVMLTLRGESGADVLPRTLAALSWLEANGGAPTAEPGKRTGGPSAPADPNAPRCPEHGTPMRSGARGWFCPRKNEVGDYCRQTAPAGAGGAK